jgi:hypothetical protein
MGKLVQMMRLDVTVIVFPDTEQKYQQTRANARNLHGTITDNIMFQIRKIDPQFST